MSWIPDLVACNTHLLMYSPGAYSRYTDQNEKEKLCYSYMKGCMKAQILEEDVYTKDIVKLTEIKLT